MLNLENIFTQAIADIDKNVSLKSSSSLFEFEPVPLDVFIKEKTYLGLPSLSIKQYEAVEIATQVYFPETLRELKWRKRRFVNEIVVLWGKGCKIGTSLLCDTYTGEMKTVKELIEEKRGIQVKSLDYRKYHLPSILDKKTSIPWIVGKDKVYKVVLVDGSELVVNETHKFFKHRYSAGGCRFKGEWTQLKDLKAGDKVATSIYEYETWKKGDKDLWWILGLLIGDGVLSGGGKEVDKGSCLFVVDKKKKELKSRIQSVLERCGCFLQYRGVTGWSENAEIFSICGEKRKNNFIRRECKRLGLLGKNAYNKFVPNELFTLDKDTRVEFLRGLLETDGWVSSYNIFNARITEIGYSSASKELIFGVKRLLASLGIRCRIRVKVVKSKHGIHYTLKVRDKFNGEKLLKYLGWEDKAEWSSKRGHRESNNEVVFERIKSIEYMGEEDVYDLEVEGTHNYVDADGFLNHNSGKDFVARIIHLRVAYLLLALKNPQAYYFHPDHPVGIEPFHLLNTAYSKVQANNVFFSPLRKMVLNSPFFKVRSDVLMDTIRFEKNINLISGHSEAEAQEGMNLLISVLDEIAAFKTDEEVADIKRLRLRKTVLQSASAIYDFVHSSRVTRFPKVGKVILLSFPRFKGDFITTKYEEGKNNPKVFTSFGATFEINPTKKISDFDDERLRNVVRYNCRILCKPGVAEDAFFKNEMAITRAFKKELENPVDKYTNRLKSWFRCEDKFLRFGHIDLAKSRDRAALALVHAYDVQEHQIEVGDGEGGTESKTAEFPLLKADIIAYFKAPYNGEINYNEIMDMVIELHEDRGFNIELLTFDGYQSVQMMQVLENRGITVANLSVDRIRDPYEAWQDVLYDGRFICYWHPILVEEEIPFLIDYKGRKIEHRKGRSKDGADAMAGAVYNCIINKGWGAVEFWHK